MGKRIRGRKTYMLNAKKGKKYPIKIEYMQRTGSADLNFTVGVRTPVDFKLRPKVKDADVIVFMVVYLHVWKVRKCR